MREALTTAEQEVLPIVMLAVSEKGETRIMSNLPITAAYEIKQLLIKAGGAVSNRVGN